MNFVKMHGLGNDFVMVDGFSVRLAEEELEPLARRVCDRHFGIGADGLILALPSEMADFRMRIFNSDGSEAMHCGNGVRCMAKFVYELGHTHEDVMRVETAGQRLNVLQVFTEGGKVQSVRVDMGEPGLTRAQIPMIGDPHGEAVEEPLEVGGETLRFTCVSFGNPHAVTFVDDPATFPVERLGPLVEHHAAFPQRTNTEFIQVLGPNELKMRVWERGAGETLACGTGACASVVAAARTGRAARHAIVHLLGGDLQIEWRDDNHVYMTGPAVESFRGEYPY